MAGSIKRHRGKRLHDRTTETKSTSDIHWLLDGHGLDVLRAGKRRKQDQLELAAGHLARAMLYLKLAHANCSL